jgi:hypothetical protein
MYLIDSLLVSNYNKMMKTNMPYERVIMDDDDVNKFNRIHQK